MSWGWTVLTNLPLRGKFINTVQFAGQADPAVETLSDDAGQQHPPPVGLDVFLAYLLRVYRKTMVDMHQSQSQKMVLWHPALQVPFDPSETLKDRSASALPTGSVQLMHRSCLTFGNWSSSACWRHPKRLTGWLCAGCFSQWATHSYYSSAGIAVGVGRSSSQNFMKLRCYILQTWLQLQKVDWDQAESKLIYKLVVRSLRLVWHKWTLPGLLLGSLVPCGSCMIMVCIDLYARRHDVQ